MDTINLIARLELDTKQMLDKLAERAKPTSKNAIINQAIRNLYQGNETDIRDLPERTAQQISELAESHGYTKTQLVIVAIDRLYQQERKTKMNGKYFSIDSDKLDAVVTLVQASSTKATEDEIVSIIDGDWPNADEHQVWLNTASAKEIAEWVDGIWVNTVEDAHIND